MYQIDYDDFIDRLEEAVTRLGEVVRHGPEAVSVTQLVELTGWSQFARPVLYKLHEYTTARIDQKKRVEQIDRLRPLVVVLHGLCGLATQGDDEVGYHLEYAALDWEELDDAEVEEAEDMMGIDACEECAALGLECRRDGDDDDE